MRGQRTIAYLVKAWPRLSETFILNEIVSLERRGVPIRIFSTKEPDTGPAHSEIAQVRAEVTYLALRQHWKQAAVANLRGLGRQPRRYLHVLFEVTERAIRQRRFAALKHFFKAAYLADILRYKPADHLHAHFASAPTMVAMFTHQPIHATRFRTGTKNVRDHRHDMPAARSSGRICKMGIQISSPGSLPVF